MKIRFKRKLGSSKRRITVYFITMVSISKIIINDINYVKLETSTADTPGVKPYFVVWYSDKNTSRTEYIITDGTGYMVIESWLANFSIMSCSHGLLRPPPRAAIREAIAGLGQ